MLPKRRLGQRTKRTFAHNASVRSRLASLNEEEGRWLQPASWYLAACDSTGALGPQILAPL